jgi:hypothetical protein
MISEQLQHKNCKISQKDFLKENGDIHTFFFKLVILFK